MKIYPVIGKIEVKIFLCEIQSNGFAFKMHNNCSYVDQSLKENFLRVEIRIHDKDQNS